MNLSEHLLHMTSYRFPNGGGVWFGAEYTVLPYLLEGVVSLLIMGLSTGAAVIRIIRYVIHCQYSINCTHFSGQSVSVNNTFQFLQLFLNPTSTIHHNKVCQ